MGKLQMRGGKLTPPIMKDLIKGTLRTMGN